MKKLILFMISVIMSCCFFSACDFNTYDKNSAKEQVSEETNVETVEGSDEDIKMNDEDVDDPETDGEDLGQDGNTETGTDDIVGGENENGQGNGNKPGYIIVEPISDGGTFQK